MSSELSGKIATIPNLATNQHPTLQSIYIYIYTYTFSPLKYIIGIHIDKLSYRIHTDFFQTIRSGVVQCGSTSCTFTAPRPAATLQLVKRPFAYRRSPWEYSEDTTRIGLLSPQHMLIASQNIRNPQSSLGIQGECIKDRQCDVYSSRRADVCFFVLMEKHRKSRSTQSHPQTFKYPDEGLQERIKCLRYSVLGRGDCNGIYIYISQHIIGYYNKQYDGSV